eukprot:comp40928_c0_seq1/m.47430 comp40928_c0_seq1/g.47430  ORF comp40928_c0_seq1/g.47430 comp40928_c0_seq1/m.47430 type:complete len:199 (-) comp40928_c0_seq1:213-809(-)
MAKLSSISADLSRWGSRLKRSTSRKLSRTLTSFSSVTPANMNMAPSRYSSLDSKTIPKNAPPVSGHVIYENPPPVTAVQKEFKAQRAYVSGERDGFVFFERHKGNNTTIYLALDETGLTVFTSDHRVQSVYSYGEMTNITHTRSTNGNYLAVRMKDGERCVFWSKETDSIKASLVAHVKAHTDLKFGAYENNYSDHVQ